MAKPKLALIPAAQGSKFYSVLPSSGVGDFDFTRSGSATRINSQGLIETVGNGVSRLNYPLIDGKVVGCPSHLLEPQRSNSFQQSNQFDTTWQISAAGISVTPNQVGVGGSTDAWKLTEGTYSGEHFIRQTPNVGGVVSVSVYAKAGTNDFIYLRGVNGGANKRTWFNLSNGTVGTSQGISAEMISMGNGWYRCVMVLDHQTAFEYYIATSKADGVSSYQGDNGFIYIQNSQLEQGSYPTSYIPTSGSVVTRSAETANGSGDASTFNDSEGVLMAEMAWINNDLDVNADLSLSDNSTSNRILITQTTTKNQIEMFFRGTGATISQFFTLNDTSNFNKFAIKYKSTDFAFYINGFKLFESNSVATVSNLFDLSFDNPSGGGTRNFYGNTKQIQYFDTTDIDLETLTSWVSFSDMANGQLYTIE